MSESWQPYYNAHGNCSKPCACIKIDGTPLKFKSDYYVEQVYVETSIDGEAGLCSIEILSSNSRFQSSPTGIEFKPDSECAKIKDGAKVDVLLGYEISKPDALTTVFVGYISGHCTYIDDKGIVRCTINVMDGRMWMMANKKSNDFKLLQKSYSAALQQTLGNYANKFMGPSPTPTPAPVSLSAPISPPTPVAPPLNIKIPS